MVASERDRGVRSRLTGRLGGRLQLPANRQREFSANRQSWDLHDNRFPNSEDDEEEEEEIIDDDYYDEDDDVQEIEEEDDYAKELARYRRLRNIPAPKTKAPRITSARSSFKPSASAPVTISDDEDDDDDDDDDGVLVVRDGGDVRSRLGNSSRRRKGGGNRNFPSMRIEVFDDDD